MWQTSGEVNALAMANGVVFAGGTFTRVRPPGTAAGTNETTRNYLAAFNESTGALITSFNVPLTGAVKDLAVSGNTLYVAGQGSATSGTTTRSRLLAITLSGTAANLTGTLNTAFNPSPNKTVWSVAATPTTVYFSGDFTTVKGTARANIASVTAATGALNTAFTTTLTQRPDAPCRIGTSGCPASGFVSYLPHALAIKLAPDGSRLLVGGNFMGTNGDQLGGMASLDPATGATQTWNANSPTDPNAQPINTNCAGRVTDIAVSGTTAYVTGEGDPPGCYEGTYAANISDGTLKWLSSCLGASQGITVMNGILFKASHQHDCALNQGGDAGGFVGGTSRDAFLHRYLVAQDANTGNFVHWTPNTNASGTTSIGPHVIASDPSTGVIVVGGDFARVNGAAQQTLARFTSTGNTATPRTPGVSYNGDPWPNVVAKVQSNLAVRVVPTAAGTLTIEVPAVEDWDNGTLTYRIYRDGSNTPIAGATQTAESFPWSRPVIRYDDKGLGAGSTHSYRVDATDGLHTSAKSTAVSATVPTAAPPTLAAQLGGLNPLAWWGLNDGGSPTADDSGNGHTGLAQGGVLFGQQGAGAGNNGVTLDGSSGYLTSSDQIAAPNSFSESAWFKTTSTSGGVILAQSDQQTGSGGNTDRMITMDNNGNLVFALKANTPPSPFGVPTINFRNQGPIWNDGKWHLVVGTFDSGSDTISLYVDGSLQGTAQGTPFDVAPTFTPAKGMPTSYLRAGYADLSQMQLFFGINFYHRTWPVSSNFSGSIDEVAAFNTVLTPAQVQGMWAAGVGGGA